MSLSHMHTHSSYSQGYAKGGDPELLTLCVKLGSVCRMCKTPTAEPRARKDIQVER